MRYRAVLALVTGALWLAQGLALAAGEETTDKKREWPALEVGSVPHDELGKDVDGDVIKLSEHRGKVIIVSFWAS